MNQYLNKQQVCAYSEYQACGDCIALVMTSSLWPQAVLAQASNQLKTPQLRKKGLRLKRANGSARFVS